MSTTVTKAQIQVAIDLMKDTLAMEGLSFILRNQQVAAECAANSIKMLEAFERDLNAL